MVRVLSDAPIAWLLGAFYFLTFGGFVAFSIYLPTLLRTQFGLRLRTPGFAPRASSCWRRRCGRSAAGWRIASAARRCCRGCSAAIAGFALLLAWPSMVPFTVGALACAALLGLGNGAVFKLVPERFPTETGTVTGLVGALGGLGGFFPPLLLGVFRDRLGVLWPGFALLSLTALGLRVREPARVSTRRCRVALALPPAARQRIDRVRAGAWAAGVTARRSRPRSSSARATSQHFDAALVGYTFATLFATFGITYRYAMWLDRPPTRMYWRRGWQAFVSRAALRRKSGRRSGGARVVEFAANRFIFRRGRLRGLAHWLIMWGCLARGGDHASRSSGAGFTSRPCPGDLDIYRTFVFGVPVQDFPVESLAAFVIFHGLVWSSFLVIAGVMLAFRRRMIDHGAVADAAVRAGHPAADAAVRDQRHRPDAHGQLHLDERLRATTSSPSCTR